MVCENISAFYHHSNITREKTLRNPYPRYKTLVPTYLHLQFFSMAVLPAAEPTSAKTVTATVNAILNVLERYRLDSAHETSNRSSEGRNKFIPIIQNKVEAGAPIHMVLPGFPFKSPNSVSKVFGTLPDKAEEFALAHLNALCKSIGDIYKGGAELTIISDGLVYNGMVTLLVECGNLFAKGEYFQIFWVSRIAMSGRMGKLFERLPRKKASPISNSPAFTPCRTLGSNPKPSQSKFTCNRLRYSAIISNPGFRPMASPSTWPEMKMHVRPITATPVS